MGIGGWHEVKPAREGREMPLKPEFSKSTRLAPSSKVRKPTLDEMGPGTESKIFQPTNSRQSGQEFGPAPRSTGGAPGKRGGWKKR